MKSIKRLSIIFVIMTLFSLLLVYADCGDGILESGESCDDGNFYNHDDCLADCTLPYCGDGYFHENSTEECDDGNFVDGDGCTADCMFEQGECAAHIDIVLIIDRSTSMMQDADGLTRIERAKLDSIRFINETNQTLDQIGVVSFATESMTDQSLTFDHDEAKDAIANIEILDPAPQRTNIGEGLRDAWIDLTSNAQVDSKKVIVLLTDGAPNEWGDPAISCMTLPETPTDCTDYALEQAQIAKDEGIEIFVIGVGVVNPFRVGVLTDIATSGENYYNVSGASFEDIYANISENLCPCNSYDCSINDNECNRGYCNIDTDECVFGPLPEETVCETDSDLCSDQMCNAEGVCELAGLVDCSSLDNQCQLGYCDPSDGECYTDPFDVGTSCETDSSLCTTQECDGLGECVVNFTVDCGYLDTQCKEGECEPSTGLCVEEFYPYSTVCEVDGRDCTIDHCDGEGYCVTLENNCPIDMPDCKVAQALPNSNFGSGVYMMVNPKIGGVDRSYLLVNVSGFNGIQSAVIELPVYFAGPKVVGKEVAAYYCPDYTFDEDTITWSNQPFDDECTLADTYLVTSKTLVGIPETWHTFDITDEAIADEDGMFTIVLLSHEVSSTNDMYVQYLTSEYGEENYRPRLRVTT